VKLLNPKGTYRRIGGAKCLVRGNPKPTEEVFQKRGKKDGVSGELKMKRVKRSAEFGGSPGRIIT